MKQIFIGVLVCVVALLSACGTKQLEPMGSETLSVPSVDVHKKDKIVSSIPEPESSGQDAASAEELQDEAEEPTSYPEVQTENTTAPAVSPKPSEPPAANHQPQADLPAAESSEPTPDLPPETEMLPAVESRPTAEPVPEQEPEKAIEQNFDINFWVSYAQSYGQSLGLSYDSTATDCWDNPIIASGRSLYLERDIQSRLELYAADGMTYFCVWAQPRSDGGYDLYIGYA